MTRPVHPESRANSPGNATSVQWTPEMRELTAADIMTTNVVTVSRETPLQKIVERLVDRGISAVPVVTRDMVVVGLVSQTDLIDEEKRRVKLPRTLLFGVLPTLEQAVRAVYEEGQGLTAEDLMTEPAFTLPDETPARAVIEQMVTRKINHVPITRDGRLAGIVARADALRAIQMEWRNRSAATDERMD